MKTDMLSFLLGLWLGGALVGSIIMYKTTKQIYSALIMIIWPILPLFIRFGRPKD